MMSQITQEETDNRPEREHDAGAGYYVFYRLWENWLPDSGFPFERFNALPDDRFADEVEKFIETSDECKAKYTEYLERDWEQELHESRQPVRNDYHTKQRRKLIESYPWVTIQEHAKGMGLSFDLGFVEKSELIQQVLEAEERILKSQQKPQPGIESLKDGREEFIRRGREKASLRGYAQVMGWCEFSNWFSASDFKAWLRASRRQIVWRTGLRNEAEEIASTLQTLFTEDPSQWGYDNRTYDSVTGRRKPSPEEHLCPKFGILPEKDIAAQDRLTIQRIIEILSGSEPPSEYTTRKLYKPKYAREVAREASALASTMVRMKEPRQPEDVDPRSANAMDSKVERQRGRPRADEATRKLPWREDSYITHLTLAKAFGAKSDNVRKRLERFRSKNHECYRENAESDRKPHEPRYMYRVGAILPVIEALETST